MAAVARDNLAAKLHEFALDSPELLNQALQGDADFAAPRAGAGVDLRAAVRAPPSTAPRACCRHRARAAAAADAARAPPDTTSDAALAARICAIADAIEIDREVMRAASACRRRRSVQGRPRPAAAVRCACS